jgi:S-adenosyl-L-methionine methyltransferase
MSRLDSMIARLSAQRLCLAHTFELIKDVPGVIFEVGLGNGRTYSHLREHLSGREIYVFDRAINAHLDSRPDADHAFLGQIEDTLPVALARFSKAIAFVHADIGDGTPEYGKHMSAVLSAALPSHMASGTVIACDQELTLPQAAILTVPGLADLRRYFMYRWP